MDAPSPKLGRGTLPWIGSSYRPWPSDAVPPPSHQISGDDLIGAFLATVDPPIRPLIAAMNRTGWILTVFSCGGHPEEPDSVQWGRRQAHVDVLIRRTDLGRWQSLVRRCAQLAPAAVAALRLVPDVGVQCTEASLGDVPPWLAGFVPQVGADSTAAEARSWVSRRLSLRRQPAWLYRRLVFEPVPYDAAPGQSRQVLDAALSAALEAISAHEQDT